MGELRCARCDAVVSGRCVRGMERVWHPHHFTCEAGGETLDGAFVERDGRAYCQPHYLERFGVRCAIGGEIIRGAYLTNDWGDRYCEAHARDAATCCSCQRPLSDRLTNGGIRYEDGRNICGLCLKTAVRKESDGREVVTIVRAALASQGLELGDVVIPLRLVAPTELMNRARRTDGHPEGVACLMKTGIPGGQEERRVQEILILCGLSREHFAAVAAHELGHAYMFLKEFPELPEAIAEGLCELCSYLWLSGQRTPTAAWRLKLIWKNRDDIYGLGFRSARMALHGRSLLELLEFVRRHGCFPN